MIQEKKLKIDDELHEDCVDYPEDSEENGLNCSALFSLLILYIPSLTYNSVAKTVLTTSGESQKSPTLNVRIFQINTRNLCSKERISVRNLLNSIISYFDKA